MNWLINQLFGAQASTHLADKVKALVAQYLLSNPSITEASVQAWVMAQADKLIAQVLVFFPGWASAILTSYLNAEIESLAANAFKSLTAGAIAQAGS